LHAHDCQGLSFLDGLGDSVYHEIRKFTVLLPALISELHLKLKVAVNAHKLAILLEVNLATDDIK